MDDSNGGYVNFGAGFDAPTSWINFDSSLTLRFERIPVLGRLYTKNPERFPENVMFGDIVKGLPVPENYCIAVYSSHVLEHLSLEELRTALQNIYRIMKKGGKFRFVIPDLEYCIREYISDTSDSACTKFLKTTMLGVESRKRNLKEFLPAWLGGSKHLWMWDYKGIKKELVKAGFIQIRRAYFGDSSDQLFRFVESMERWENCLGVECEK